MDILKIIEKKKNKKELSFEEIEYFINGYVENKIPDYQISSLLMAILLNGLEKEEIINLTKVMVVSGEVLNYDNLTNKVIIDKHSTGGVGDKTSLVLVPLLASLGFGVSKMSGRGLGFTGGTIDKLEAIPGFKTELSKEKIIEQVENVGCIIVGQSLNIVPADKKLYSLRDVTGTVDSIGLIASSIMCKKIALGANIILLDIKYGSGGFMKTVEEAKKLANTMKLIGDGLNKKIICFITSMNEPLGQNIGNSLEVIEAVNTLKDCGNEDLKRLCVNMAAEALVIEYKYSIDEAKEIVIEKIKSGEALEKFYEMLFAQGVKERQFELKRADNIHVFRSDKEGYIKEIKTDKIGFAAQELGAGRKVKEDIIDSSVGLELIQKIGDYVQIGDELVKIHYNNEQKLTECLKILSKSYNIVKEKVNKADVIEEIIN